MRPRTLLSAGAFILPLLLYLTTVCPTVHLGDSGELNLAAATLGIPHVPGYPLLAQTGYLITQLPFGNGAFRGNLLSAFAGALAVFLFYQFLLYKFKRPALAFAFAMALAGSFTLWEQSLKIRAYPLNTCFAIGVIYLTCLWREHGDRRYLYSLALLMGLGLANHEILLVVAPVPLVAMVADYRKLTVGQVAFACLLGILGLSVYAYLPLRAAADPVLNWGDPDSLSRFFDVLFQKQYAGKMLNPDWDNKITVIGIILRSFVTELGPLVAVMGVFGIWFAWVKDRVLLIGLFGLFLLNTALRINYIGEHEFHQVLRYMISSIVAYGICAAFLADALMRSIEEGQVAGLTKKIVTAVFLVLVAAPPMLTHASKTDLSQHRVSYDFIQSVLDYPEPDYVLTVGGDNNVFPLWYLQRFERYREDVVVMPIQTFRADWLAAEIVPRLPAGVAEPGHFGGFEVFGRDKQFFMTLDRLLERGYPTYTLFDSTVDPKGAAAMEVLRERHGLIPCGLAFRFSENKAEHCAVDSWLWDQYALDLMDNPELYRDFHTSDLLSDVAVMLTRRGMVFAQRGEPGRAIRNMAQAVRVMPDDPWPAMSLANVLARVGQAEQALEIYDNLVQQFPDEPIYKHNRDLILNAVEKKGQP